MQLGFNSATDKWKRHTVSVGFPLTTLKVPWLGLSSVGVSANLTAPAAATCENTNNNGSDRAALRNMANGAVYASADATTAVDTTGIQNAAEADAGNLDREQLQVTSSTDNSSSPTYVAVTVTYPFTTITHYPGIPKTTNLSCTVRASVLPDTPDFY